MQGKSLLKFWIGPVQPFVAASRTARDLWTGSFLLAWLVDRASKPIDEAGGTFVVPDIALLRENGNGGTLKTPTLPNHFTASVSVADDKLIAGKCREALSEAWSEICRSVHAALADEIKKKSLPYADAWDRLWSHQVENFFDVRTVVLPPNGQNDVERIREINRLLAADKAIRHFPPDTPDGPVPGKCSLLGDLEQMGPAGMRESREFWQAFADAKREKRVDIHGTRVREGERLCAVSLVKRFAWPAYLAEKTSSNPEEMRIHDTPRVAAELWLAKHSDLQVEADTQKSAAWVYWQSEDQDSSEPPVPKNLWTTLCKARKEQPPPTYYAILNLDGDNMGKRLQAAVDLQGIQKISEQTAAFARNHVEKIVKNYKGNLVYGGGDDVLALLPAQNAVACAMELSKAFGDCVKPCTGFDKEGTVSIGIVIVHHKEDLRFALESSREAEKTAKNTGRNRLALSICRRSGEHSTATLSWEACVSFNSLVQHFINGASDRWAYRLRTEADTLASLPVGDIDAMKSETTRLLNRTENPPKDFKDNVLKFLDLIRADMPTALHADPKSRFPDFVVLCQSASFLARGRDE